jgi:hypothetical protein
MDVLGQRIPPGELEAVDRPEFEVTFTRPDRLLVLDFSGTLSLEAALFGSEASLVEALKLSGLWEIGLDSTEAFWKGVVDPTWQEGSTTGIGYTALLVRRLREWAAGRGETPDGGALQAAAARFVEEYLRHSAVDPAWGPAIHRLLRNPGLWVIVATDHYTEATGHVLRQLSSLGLGGAPLLQPGAQRVLVANSADLGHPKATREFWAEVHRVRRLDPARVVLIDDFGLNEQARDEYAHPWAVARRRDETVAALTSVFAVPVRVFPFFLGAAGPVAVLRSALAGAPARKEHLMRRYRRLISEASDFASRELSFGV